MATTAELVCAEDQRRGSAGGLLWAIGAIEVLAAGRVSTFVTDVIAAALRYQFRLFAYHLSSVDRYPCFEVAERRPFTGPRAA